MRRAKFQGTEAIWSGFVDILSNLLIVIMFMLLLFILGYFVLRQSSQGLSNNTEEINSILVEREQKIADLNNLVMSLEGDIIKEQQRATTAEVQATSLKAELIKLNAALDAADENIRAQNIQIVEMSNRLNRALANKTAQLSEQLENQQTGGNDLTPYASEFFAILSKSLGDHPDFRVQGDRFIFQSEVLFDSGSAALEPEGLRKLDRLADSLKQVMARIPADVKWILRVDGHTDSLPIRNRAFKSNWELSTARAIAVVRYLEKKGIPSKRLVAAGFGENQPLKAGKSAAALRQNRRIEFKLTER